MPQDYNSNSEHTVVFLVAPGDILDERWLIEARIGQGAMGSVFRGSDSKLDRKVAIKILAPEHCRKPKVLARFEREATLMTTLRHPNIIQIFGVGRRGALPYIVMQFLEGMTLADVLKQKGGKLTPGETLAVVKQIAAGLSFIHHHGLVHRDIKPQNIFVSPGGRVTILDLGVVRDKANPGLTKPGAMVGTPYYMSPEQIQGTDEIDKRTDVYALAAMTFELLCGRPPFLGQTNFEVLHAHRYLEVPDASELNKAVNKQAARALATAMSKKREDRPLSASEFSADLEAFFGQAEKVDPAVAFSFLDDLKAAEDKKALAKAAAKASTRAQTVPQVKALPDKPRAPLPPPVRTPTEGETPIPKASTRAVTSTSGEVPIIASGEFQLVGGATGPLDLGSTRPLLNPFDTESGDEPAPGDTASELKNGETRDGEEDRTSLTDPGKSDPGETVTEAGELRVITTLRGLTTQATLFVDGGKQGLTPTSIQMPAGRHVVRVERLGYKAVEKPAQVIANQVTLIRIELTK